MIGRRGAVLPPETARPTSASRRQEQAAPRVGLFGLLGSGNTGNDVSMESILRYLRSAHPEAEIDAMCGGPQTLRARYGIDAIPVLWYQRYEHLSLGPLAPLLKAAGKGIDAGRTLAWVRRHNVVIVPGAGALEATLPVRAMGFPYSMFLLGVSGRLTGTRVALVSVGANQIRKRLTRTFLNGAARLAYYRSYRDQLSREAMQQRGVDTTADRVFPDLAFAAPLPEGTSAGDSKMVGLGVMGYYGGPDDTRDSARLHDSYVYQLKLFTRWLVDSGHILRIFGGDDQFDETVAQELAADARTHRPDLPSDRVTIVRAASFDGLMREMAPVGTVVATRYHNVVCALRLGKPTLALGYSQKFLSLMTDMGLGEFCQPASALDADLLIKQFTELECKSADLRRTMADRLADKAALIDAQYELLSHVLFAAPGGSEPG